MCRRHFLKKGWVAQECGNFPDNILRVGSHHFNRPGLYCLRTFGGITHDDDRFSQAWGFLLHAAGIGQNEGGTVHERNKGQVVQWFDEMNVG